MVNEWSGWDNSLLRFAVRLQEVCEQTTRRRTVRVMIMDGQTLEDVRLGQEVKAGDAEAVLAGLVLDATDTTEWRQQWFVTPPGFIWRDVVVTPTPFSSKHHRAKWFSSRSVTSWQMFDKLIGWRKIRLGVTLEAGIIYHPVTKNNTSMFENFKKQCLTQIRI